MRSELTVSHVADLAKRGRKAGCLATTMRLLFLGSTADALIPVRYVIVLEESEFMRVRNYGIQISATAYAVYKLVASALADIAAGAAVPMLSRGVLCSGVLMTAERTP